MWLSVLAPSGHLRNGFYYSPQLSYTTDHADIFPTVFFQFRVLNLHPEPTNKQKYPNKMTETTGEDFPI